MERGGYGQSIVERTDEQSDFIQRMRHNHEVIKIKKLRQ